MSTYTDRRRNVGLPPKPTPISFTALQRVMHEESQKMKVANKTRGAFGGISRMARQVRDANKAPKDLLPKGSPLA